jgi:hypothetical protein
MRLPATLKWIGLALLGILIAAAVAIAASRLASQQIGLASEPISAGNALAPQLTRSGRAPGHQGANRPPATTTSVPTTTTATPEPAPTETQPTPTDRRSHGEGGDDHGGGDGAPHEGGDD